MAQFSQPPGNQGGGFLQQLLSPEVAMPMAAALMGNQGNAANFGNAFGAYGQAQAQRAGQNKTLEYFRQNAPEFAAMVEAGMPVNEAWGTYTKQRYAQKAGPRFGLNPIYGTDDEGNPAISVLGDDGSMKRVDTGGFNISTGVDRVDLGTQWGLLDKRSGQMVGTLPKDNYTPSFDSTSGSEDAKRLAAARADLGKVEDNAYSILAAIDSLDKDPYLDSMTGPVYGRLPNISAEAGRVQSKMDRIGGQAFLQAFETLKGGGQITEIEGKKATEAIARLNTSQSPADYRQALNELREIVNRGLARARSAAGLESMGGDQPSPQGGVVDYRDYFGGR